MKVLVIGAAGMIGRKLVERLARDGDAGGRKDRSLDGRRHRRAVAAAGAVSDRDAKLATSPPLYMPGKLAAARPDVVFLLASVVSGEAEADFDKGYGINLDGTRMIFDALRREQALSGGAYRPRIVFTSSIAVFGAPFPEKIGDEFFTTPLTSYGTQKAICELLLSDYSRRGFFDGIAIRLPTICVRPGTPNKAASGFFSNIIREPLKGEPAVLPVDGRRAPPSRQPARRGRLPAARGEPRSRQARRAAGADDAGRLGDGRRADRGVAPRRRRQGGGADPARARRDDPPHRRRLADASSTPSAPRRSASQAEKDFDAIIRAHIEDEHV